MISDIEEFGYFCFWVVVVSLVSAIVGAAEFAEQALK